MRTTPTWEFPPRVDADISATATSAISGNGGGCGVSLYAERDMIVDKIAVYVHTTTVAGDLTATIQTVTGSTFAPSGTLYHANATSTVSLLTSDDAVWKEFTFAAPITITAGDTIAFCCNRVSGTFTGSLLITRSYDTKTNIPALFNSATGAMTLNTGRIPVFAVHDTTLGYFPMLGSTSFIGRATQNVASNTTPDEIGIYFTMPYTARCRDIWFTISGFNNTDSIRVRLYDASNNVLFSQTNTFGTSYTVTTAGYHAAIIPNGIVLKKGQSYRATIESLTTGAMTIAYWTVGTGYPNVHPSGGWTQWTERTDAGSWTDSATRHCEMFMRFDQIATNAPAHPRIG